MATPSPYNGSTARICAELSNLIYQSPVEIKQRVATLIPNAEVTLHNISLGNSRICIVSSEKEIFVVFRGTVITSPRSVIANLRATRTRWGNGLVHRGFLSLFLAAAPFIHQALRDYKVETKDLYFTGHSQGAAAAYLAAMIFALGMRSPKPNAVYTFGQPRAGNAEFSRDAEKRLQKKSKQDCEWSRYHSWGSICMERIRPYPRLLSLRPKLVVNAASPGGRPRMAVFQCKPRRSQHDAISLSEPGQRASSAALSLAILVHRCEQRRR
jgi:hypothetical protein